MGNIISFDGNISENDNSLSMSNGLTDVFLDYLLISGSELTKNDSEKILMVFLAEKQQSVIGIGDVDFDIIEMPWQKSTFENDKIFILKVINYARKLSFQKNIWNKLGYEPNRELLEYALDKFEILIKHMTENDIDSDSFENLFNESDKNNPIYCGFPKCPKHGIFLSFFGCKFCNDRK